MYCMCRRDETVSVELPSSGGHLTAATATHRLINSNSFFIVIFPTELEANEACRWLRATGFPQYAQMYEGEPVSFIHSSIHFTWNYGAKLVPIKYAHIALWTGIYIKLCIHSIKWFL